jgi:hypothetical protein
MEANFPGPANRSLYLSLRSTREHAGVLFPGSMSDDIENTPAAPEAPAAKVAKKRPAVRKSSKPAAKKAEEAAPAAAVESAPSEPAAAAPAPAPRKEEVKMAGPSEAAEVTSSEASDGGRIALFVDTPAPEPGGGSKKRRRRKKKHGQGQGGQAGGPLRTGCRSCR